MKKEIRFLITTALEATWVDNQPVLFLGDWCQLYSRRSKWMAMDGVVLPYHWHDREKLYLDYQYLTQLYERFLPILAQKLNELHSVEHDLRYWRILIGPWLLRMTHIVFDRWETIQQALTSYEITGAVTLCNQEVNWIPTNMLDFVNRVQDDDWNHQIYAKILNRHGHIPQTNRTRVFEHESVDWFSTVPIKKNFTAKLSDLFAKYLARGNKFFFRDTYLPQSALIRLSLSFFQIPQRKITLKQLNTAPDLQQRTWQLDVTTKTQFEKFLRDLIPEQIPTFYLEGYAGIAETLVTLPWPRDPNLIFTSNALWHDDIAKAYAAEKIERGTVLVYGQHGGGYGTARFNVDEEHEVRISDHYLSMGWIDSQNSKVIPIGHFGFKRKCLMPFNTKTDLLLVTLDASRYTFRGCSESAVNMKKYIADSFRFVESLPKTIQHSVVVRLTSGEHGWFHAARWRDQFAEIKIDNGDQNIQNSIKKARLVISTYNQTTILETLAAGIPSVLFCDLLQTPLRDSAIPFYSKLKQVGIFHDTPESAASHVNRVWGDIDSWWFSEDVQSVVTEFTQQYCRRETGLVPRIRTVLKQAVRKDNAAIV